MPVGGRRTFTPAPPRSPVPQERTASEPVGWQGREAAGNVIFTNGTPPGGWNAERSDACSLCAVPPLGCR